MVTWDLYRVRHPAAPDLFVWVAGERERNGLFRTPLSRCTSSLGASAELTILFSETHPGFSKEEAERIAAFVGGTVEEVRFPTCSPCARGDHSSHDNQGRAWDGTSFGLDAFDCKNLLDRFNQCCCRATWPEVTPDVK